MSTPVGTWGKAADADLVAVVPISECNANGSSVCICPKLQSEKSRPLMKSNACSKADFLQADATIKGQISTTG
jgi:hypothetical protein